jgi:uncharacterized repeat protein (TIGR01451 family)
MNWKHKLAIGLWIGMLIMGLSLVAGSAHKANGAENTLFAAPPELVTTTLPLLPQPVGDGVAFVLTDTLYYAGGWAGTASDRFDTTNALSVNPLGNAWGPSANTLAPARFGATSVVVNDRGYVIGGYDGTITNRVESFDGLSWRVENASGLSALNFPAAAAVQVGSQTRIYIAGGLPGPTDGIWSTQVLTDGTLSNWRSETTRLPRGLATQTAALGNCLYIIGGRDSSGNWHAEIYGEKLNVDGTIPSWGNPIAYLPVPLALHAVAIDQNTLYVLGGETTNGNLNDQVFAYTIDPQTCALTRNTVLEMTLPGGGNRRLAATTRFGELYVLGGQTAAGYTNQVWKAELPIPDPVLTLYKSAEWEEDFDYGTLITYTLRYANPWTYPGGQTGVIITDTIPLSTTFITASEGAMYITSTNTLSWTLVTLPKDAGDVVTFTVRVDEQPTPQWELASARDARWSEDGTWLISSEIAYTVIYTPQMPGTSDISVTGTLPPQLYPRNRTSITSSMPGAEFAVNGQNVIWRVPGAITETGYLTVTTCVVQGFSTQMPLTYTISLQDTVSQTQRVYTQAIAPEVDGWVKPSCTTDTLQLGYPITVSPLEDTRPIILNQAWICSEEIAGCQPSNETITRYWPVKVFLPLVVRQY